MANRRESLIYSLVKEFSGKDPRNVNLPNFSFYDKGTGTLYCTVDKSKVQKAQIKEAEIYIEKQYLDLASKPLLAEEAMYYKIALEAIRLLGMQ